MARTRIDVLLVERGLAASRERARALLLAGQVRVGGRVVTKAGTFVTTTDAVEVATADHPYVGRGGVKLAHSLDVFGVHVERRRCLDIGASTGGFTDVLLQRGAAQVVALDVGHGQLDWAIRSNPRVTVVEHFNARRLTPADLPGPVDLVVIDVSFISLRLILPVVPPVLGEGADVVALVKPQFEAGRGEAPKGIVRDETVRRRVLAEIRASAAEVGLTAVAETESPITGHEGNIEFLLHLRPGKQRS